MGRGRGKEGLGNKVVQTGVRGREFGGNGGRREGVKGG